VRLSGAVDDTTDTLVFHQFDVPEDEALVRVGSVLELDSELVRIMDYVVDTHTATVTRHVLGTDPTLHVDNTSVKLSPPFPRQDVYNNTVENIVGLYPKLWTVRTGVYEAVGLDAYSVDDPLMVEIIEANPDAFAKTIGVEARIVDYHHLTGGRAVVTNSQAMGTLWVRYRRRFGVASSESDLLDDLGLETVWQQVVAVGVAADMLAGRDIPATFVEWVGSILQAENIQVGTRAQLSVGLVRYRQLLIERFAKEMKAEDSNRVKQHMNDPFASV
jgi:hypothetical protein